MGRFSGQVAWITGGGSGIGRAVALELARQGAKVAVSGRRQDRLQEVADELQALGTESLAVVCDVTDERSVQSALQAIVDRFGKLDLAMANAGLSIAGRVDTVTADEWRRQLEVNVIGLTTTVRVALPRLHETNGRVVLVGSVAGMIAAPGFSAYHASKYAVRAIGQCLALELHGSGVSCTTIHPGFVESEIAKVDNQGVLHPDRKDTRPKKLMWPTDRAARVMVDAMYARKREYTFTIHGKIGAWLGRHAPGFAFFVMSRSSKRLRPPRAQ